MQADDLILLSVDDRAVERTAYSPDVALTLFSAAGKPPTLKQAGHIPTREVTEQLATAFAVPVE